MWADRYSILRFPIRILFLLLLLIFGTIPTLLCVNRFGQSIRVGKRTLSEFMLNWWTLMVCRGFGISIRVKGHAQAGPVLVVANHISWIDILVLHSSAEMGFVSKAEIAKWPFIGMLARISGTVFHERGNTDSAGNVVNVMIRRLEEGGRIAVFPEGGAGLQFSRKVGSSPEIPSNFSMHGCLKRQ
jgi:1-acyl-sn-glycerol-3-phosphate acyltransferase